MEPRVVLKLFWLPILVLSTFLWAVRGQTFSANPVAIPVSQSNSDTDSRKLVMEDSGHDRNFKASVNSEGLRAETIELLVSPLHSIAELQGSIDDTDLLSKVGGVLDGSDEATKPRQATSDDILQNSPIAFGGTNGDSNSEDSPGIWITISQMGLDYLKDVLLTQILQAVTPLHLPDITKRVDLPVLGEVDTSLTKVTLVEAEVPDSTIALGNSGIAMQGSEVRANLTLMWNYQYRAGWLPSPIYDGGRADIKVGGMQAGITVNIEEQDGALSLIIMQCGTYIDDLEVQLHGGSSWLYQWLIDGLEDRIRATVEDQLTSQIRRGVQKLDSLLLGLPRQVPVDGTSELNFTIVQDPVISPTSVSIGVKGEFVSLIQVEPFPKPLVKLPSGLVCSGDMKMVTIALSESVLSSATAIYYNAGLLNWLVDKVPDQAFLNTAKWKYLIPQLYQQYPNEDMKLNFTESSPLSISVTPDGIEGVAAANMIIEVMDKNETIPVACISVIASVHGSAGLDGNNITGQVGLNDLSLNLEWSDVGNIRLTLVKVFVRTLVKDLLLPVLNLSLRRGFPLPIIPSVELRHADIKYGHGFILVCTDVQYIGTSEIYVISEL